MGAVFTLPQLQNLYESILDVKFDRRNFANKMKHFGMLAAMAGKDFIGAVSVKTPVE